MISSLVLSVTYRCNIQCADCGLKCSPNRKERMSSSYMMKIIKEANSFLSTRHVTFTGGEPLLIGKDLYDSISFSSNLGLTTRVVSNGYWGNTPENAKKTVSKLKQVGLTELNISVDDMHQEFIPLSYIKNVHDACVKNDMKVLLAHKRKEGSNITIDYLEEFFNHKLINLDNERCIYKSLSDESRKNYSFPRAYIFASGDSIPISKMNEREIISNCDNYAELGKRCDSALCDIVVTPRKQLNVCCGVTSFDIPELLFDIPDSEFGLLNAMKRANEDIVVNWLVLEGPIGIKNYVDNVDPEAVKEEKWVSRCHLCTDLLSNKRVRSILKFLDEEKMKEITYRRLVYDKKRKDSIFIGKVFGEPVKHTN